MFGLSLPKLIVLAGIIAIVWYGFKLIGRVQERRDAEMQGPDGEARLRRGDRGQGGNTQGARAGTEIEETVKCRACGAYVPVRGATSCGRPSCPF